jgi:hypothetical protein
LKLQEKDLKVKSLYKIVNEDTELFHKNNQPSSLPLDLPHNFPNIHTRRQKTGYQTIMLGIEVQLTFEIFKLNM